MPPEMLKIRIGGEDRDSVTVSNRAQQEIRVRALNPMGATGIEVFRCKFVIRCADRHIGKRPKLATNASKLLNMPQSRQKFLTNGSNEPGATFANQNGKGFCLGSLCARMATNRGRPYRSIHQNVQRRFL